MSPDSKKELNADRYPKNLDDIAYHKLFMLNLHAAIDSGYRLENIFQDLRQKHDGEYIFGKAFIADTIIDIVEKLDSLIFYLNSLSSGRDVELYSLLDGLKNYLHKCFDRSGDAEASGGSKDHSSQTVSLPDLLKEIIDFSTRIDLAGSNIISVTPGDIVTIHDLLIYCYKRVFDIMDERFETMASVERKISGRTSPLIKLPISYLLQDGMPVFDYELADRGGHGGLYSNPGASRLCEGINEVFDSGLYASFLEKSSVETGNRGMLFYSNETIVSYHIFDRFSNIVAANVCDAVGGNYINLLVNSGSSLNDPILSHRLLGKLLDWLDFHSFSAHGFTVASIGNMTRNDMENQLDMLGKLLAFVASTAIPPRDEATVQQSVDIFLENIV